MGNYFQVQSDGVYQINISYSIEINDSYNGGFFNIIIAKNNIALQGASTYTSSTFNGEIASNSANVLVDLDTNDTINLKVISSIDNVIKYKDFLFNIIKIKDN